MRLTLSPEGFMPNARFRLMTALAGATLCVFAAASYGQNTNATTDAQTGAATTAAPTQAAPTPTATDQAGTVTPSTSAQTSTTTTTWSFPGGTLGIVAVAVLVLLALFALFRGRDRTVVRETYASSSSTSPPTRNVSTGTASDDRLNVSSRAASGTGTSDSGINDPNARR
jgi:hypothetical protein